jgi:hypothetical protein
MSPFARTSDPADSASIHVGVASADPVPEIDAGMKQRAMAFEAPYVLDKLLSMGLADTPEQARMLFDEVKKYLLLAQRPGPALPMTSALVDAAWHQFILYTRQYGSFCETCLGTFCHHVPADPASEGSGDSMSREDFIELYQRSFGELPEVWDDSRCLRPLTRLCRGAARDVFYVELDDSYAHLHRDGSRQLLCRVNRRARNALEFIASHDSFLVRELPGLRSLEECIALVSPLVRFGILRIAI